MATHSSVLAWRIPRTEKPGWLLSVALHRVGHDWSNLAAAATAYQSFLIHIPIGGYLGFSQFFTIVFALNIKQFFLTSFHFFPRSALGQKGMDIFMILNMFHIQNHKKKNTISLWWTSSNWFNHWPKTLSTLGFIQHFKNCWHLLSRIL